MGWMKLEHFLKHRHSETLVADKNGDLTSLYRYDMVRKFALQYSLRGIGAVKIRSLKTMTNKL